MAWLLGVVSVLTGTLCLALLLKGMLLWALASHVASGFCGAAAAMRLRRNVHGSGWYEYVIGLGMPGAGGMLVWLQAFGERTIKRGRVAREFTEYIDASLRLGGDLLPDVRQSFTPTPDEVAPMTDILRSEANEDDKRNAIEALSRLETPDAVETLRSVLSSESTEVRFYAASALSRLEERLALRLKALEEDLAMGRQDRSMVELEMARTYHDYAYYRLVDETRREDCLERALVLANRAAEEGVDPEAWLMSGRALLALARYEEAEAMFTRYLDRVHDDVKGLVWRAEARFHMGHYRGVREDGRRARAVGRVPEVMREALEMWD